MTYFLNPDMASSGRRLESQVAGMMALLADIQNRLAEIEPSSAVREMSEELLRSRSALGETVARLHEGQEELERRLGQYVSELTSQQAALEATQAELSALNRRLVHVQEDERRALARDLHDTSGQALAVIGLGLAILRRESGASERVRARIDLLQATSAGLAEDLHRLVMNLRPLSLDRYGLVPAAEELITSLRERTGLEVEFGVEGLMERLPGEVESGLYRVIQEACANITRHAEASRASVSMACDRRCVAVRIADNGRGFDVAAELSRGRLGLQGIRERVEMLGGTFTIDSSPGRGSTLLVEVPLPPERTLPLEEAEAAALERAADPEPSPVSTAESSGWSQASELARARALSAVLLDLTKRVSEHDNQQDLLGFVLGRAAAAVGCDYALIAMQEGRRWTVSHAYGLPQSMVGQRLVPAAVPLAREIERTGKVVVVNDPRADDPLSKGARESGVLSGAGLPLVSGEEFIGAVAFVHNSAPIPFTPSEVVFLEHLSGLLSLALENTRLRGLNFGQ